MNSAKRKMLLEEMKRLLEIGWTRSALARDKYGNKVSTKSEDACSFCLSGAVLRAVFNTSPADYVAENELMSMLEREVEALNPGKCNSWNGDNFVVWNDEYGRTKEEVIALVDTLIKREQ